MSLYQSLFETTLKQGVPRPVIDQMVKIFATDVDFQRGAGAGDSVEAFYSEPDETDARPELLFATVTARGQIFRYYRFETPDDSQVDYYDENGRSTRKFLIRKPIAAGELRSGFGMRFHPILHYSRMHTGVDWANAIGTPILAAGNGVVIKAEFTSGYGRRVEVQHANGYVTTYSHMSGFARGVTPGVRVIQGQVLGYLGQTGLATGPASSLRGHRQRPLRRPDGDQTRPHARVRRQDAGAVQTRTRADRPIDGPGAQCDADGGSPRQLIVTVRFEGENAPNPRAARISRALTPARRSSSSDLERALLDNLAPSASRTRR